MLLLLDSIIGSAAIDRGTQRDHLTQLRMVHCIAKPALWDLTVS